MTLKVIIPANSLDLLEGEDHGRDPRFLPRADAVADSLLRVTGVEELDDDALGVFLVSPTGSVTKETSDPAQDRYKRTRDKLRQLPEE